MLSIALQLPALGTQLLVPIMHRHLSLAPQLQATQAVCWEKDSLTYNLTSLFKLSLKSDLPSNGAQHRQNRPAHSLT